VISILTLDEIIDRYAGGRSIEFLKIDVEGWEKEVLCGLDLKEHRLIIILIEATYMPSRGLVALKMAS
jgi:FkbM family methyltransferase